MFSFIESESFDVNLANFLEYAKEIDPIRGEILCNLSGSISSDDTTDRSVMRSRFDAEVLKRLDEVNGEIA